MALPTTYCCTPLLWRNFIRAGGLLSLYALRTQGNEYKRIKCLKPLSFLVASPINTWTDLSHYVAVSMRWVSVRRHNGTLFFIFVLWIALQVGLIFIGSRYNGAQERHERPVIPWDDVVSTGSNASPWLLLTPWDVDTMASEMCVQS